MSLFVISDRLVYRVFEEIKSGLKIKGNEAGWNGSKRQIGRGEPEAMCRANR